MKTTSVLHGGVLVYVAACLAFVLGLGGCSKAVSIEDLYGVYVASYPFGSDTITLKRDGQFIQSVQMKNETRPVTAEGRWTFNSDSYSSSYVTFYAGYLRVDDGFGRLNPNWRNPPNNTLAVPPVHKGLSNILINPEAKFPYVKQ